jgi:hypothetical protein
MPRPRNGNETVRLTTSVSREIASRLEAVARDQKVSVSWLVARAIDGLLERQGTGTTPELPLRRRIASQ